MGLHPGMMKVGAFGIQILRRSSLNQMFNFSTSPLKCQKDCKTEVIVEKLDGGRGLITLNRPKQLNTLNHSMVCKIYKTLLSWKDDIYVIGIKGCGDKAFCAGGDIVAIAKDKSGDYAQKFFRDEYKMNALISCMNVPIISLIHGIVMGGGVGLSLYGKFRVATEDTLFAMPETNIGFFPDVGVTQRLSRMPKHLGFFLGLTGYRLKGYDVVHAGIATHFVNKEDLDDLEKALFYDFGRCCASSPDEILQEFHNKAVKCMKNGTPPKFCLEDHLNCFDKWFSVPTLEESFKLIKSDRSDFATETLDLLKCQSPLSLKVTFKQLKENCSKELFDVLDLDYRIALKMFADGDACEGVRALLIDKDKTPKWKHPDISKVTDAEVNSYFTHKPPEELKVAECTSCPIDK